MGRAPSAAGASGRRRLSVRYCALCTEKITRHLGHRRYGGGGGGGALRAEGWVGGPAAGSVSLGSGAGRAGRGGCCRTDRQEAAPTGRLRVSSAAGPLPGHSAQLSETQLSSRERPQLDGSYDEVCGAGERVVVVCEAALRSAPVQVTVQVQAVVAAVGGRRVRSGHFRSPQARVRTSRNNQWR